MSGMNNQFYKDNAPNYDEFKALTSLFKGLTDIFDGVMSQAIDNSKISTMRAFTTIPIQIINVVDACYSLSTLLTNKEVLNITGISPELSVHDRMKVWNDLDPKIRATALDQMGLVLMLVNPNILKGEDAYTDTFKVIDFEMYDFNTGDRLIYGLDYYYEYNKIYFLRFGSHTNKYNNKKVILKNITIDNNTPEKILGESLGIYANSNFSPTEYRDVVTSFASAALAGPVINRINQSFNPDTALNLAARTYGLNDDENSLKGIKVVDYKSADKLKKKMWDAKVEGMTQLTAFDFLVTVPSDYLYKIEKMEYVYEFVKKIKPAQSNFILNPEYFIQDVFPMSHANFVFRSEGEMGGIIDNIEYEEFYKLPTHHATHDNIDVIVEETQKSSSHKTNDYLDVESMTHYVKHNSKFSPTDILEYSEEDSRIAYLNCITRVHFGRFPKHLSDEVLLDTDWFDCILLLEDFYISAKATFYDKAPQLETAEMHINPTHFTSDKGTLEDNAKQLALLSFNEQVNHTFKHNGDYSICTDVGVLLDTLYINDIDVISFGCKDLIDTINRIEKIDSMDLKADNIYDRITNSEENTKTVYLNCITRVHVRRNTYHSSDEVLLDTDWFDCIVMSDDFEVSIKTAFHDKAPQFTTADFRMDWFEYIVDKKSPEDNIKELVLFNLGEKVGYVYRHGNDCGIGTDINILLDVAYINDTSITSAGSKDLSDNIDSSETIDSILLKADSVCDEIISIDKSTRVAYLNCITRVHVRRNTHHSSDEVLLDTDWFDNIMLLDDFEVLAKTAFYDKAPQLTTTDFKLTWIRYLLDKGMLKDRTKQAMLFSFGEKVNHTKYNTYEKTDGMLDIMHISDAKISIEDSIGFLDKINCKADDRSLDFTKTIDERINGTEEKEFSGCMLPKDKISSSENTITKSKKIMNDNIRSIETIDSILLKANDIQDKISGKETPKGRNTTTKTDKLSSSEKILNKSKEIINDSIDEVETIDSMSLKASSVYDKIISKEIAKSCNTTSTKDNLSASDGVIRSSKESINDKINPTETIDSMSLKTDSVYDKISIREDAKGCNITSTKDSLSFVNKANITKCDSIYACDYTAETGFRLDNHNGFHADDNSIGYEVVSIKLIPKN